MNRKGFTLIELLVTIIIIGLVVGLSVYGIIKLVGDAEDKTIVISESNLKEAARIYSSEKSSDSWKKTNYAYDAFCVTVSELMNKGLLDKDVELSGNITKDDYIIVKRNKITLAVEKEEIVSNDIENEYNEVCTGQVNVGNEDVTAPTIGNSVSYTDRIEIEFNDGEAESGIKNYKCLYGTSSSNINREGTVEENKCILDNLKNNSNYYVLIYMNTNNGSSILAEGNREYNTKDFNNVTVNQNKNIVTINYDDTNVLEAVHYFKSNVDSISGKNVNKCILDNNKFTCSDSTTTIEKDTWYKVSGNVVLTYPEESNNVVINTRIYDGSNNYKEFSHNVTIEKYTIKFYKNSASSIDGSTNEYVEKYCISDGTNTCSVTSPSITAKTGYSVVGWNTSSSATTSSWNINTSKNINASTSYYAITRINKVYIKYNVNGGSIATVSNNAGTWTKDEYGIVYLNGSSAFDSINYGETLGINGLSNYNNEDYMNINKYAIATNTTFIYKVDDGLEWRCFSGCDSTYDQDTIYSASDFCDASGGDCTVELGVHWNGVFDLGWKIDGVRNNNVVDSNLMAGIKIGGVDKGYESDRWTQYSYGTEWEVYGIKLNGTSLPYTVSGVIDYSGVDMIIDVNTLNIGVNNSSYGQVSSSSLYVRPGTTYTTSGNKLKLSDGREITATTTNATGYTTSFSGWSSISGIINSATSITANFSRTVNAETINTNKFSCEAANRLAVYYVTTCTGNTCTYTTKNGLNNNYDFSTDTTGIPTWSISKSNYVDNVSNQTSITTSGNTCTRKYLYVSADAINCRSEASTAKGDETVEKTWNQCTEVYGYRTTMKINDTYNWFYSSTHDCYMWGEYLSASLPSACVEEETEETDCTWKKTLHCVGSVTACTEYGTTHIYGIPASSGKNCDILKDETTYQLYQCSMCLTN